MLARKVKLKLNKLQARQLQKLREDCAKVYNQLLEMQFDRIHNAEKTLSFFDMNKFCRENGNYGIGVNAAQSLAKRVELAIKRWQESENIKYKMWLQHGENYQAPLKGWLAKSGKKLWGKPRFKTKGVSIGLSIGLDKQTLVQVAGKYTSIRVPLVGRVRGFNDRQEIIGNVKQVTIERDECKTWWATIVCDGTKPQERIESRSPAIGVDLGLKHTITAANEQEVIQPERERFLEKQMAAIKKASRTNRRDLPFIHRKIARRRKHSHHVQARQLLEAADTIVVGNLNSKFLFASKLARSASCAAHSQFLTILSYKAANAGKNVIKVNESYTSQTCYQCGKRHKMPLSERYFACDCGYEKDRDVNAALNIMKLGECRRPAAS